MKQIEVSRATMGRIPMYLKYLKSAIHSGDNISATTIAKQLGLGEVQVRKDLSAVSGAGRPKTGYNIGELIASLENFLNDGTIRKVVLIGAGKIGRALLDYKGLRITVLKSRRRLTPRSKRLNTASRVSPSCRRTNLTDFVPKMRLK